MIQMVKNFWNPKHDGKIKTVPYVRPPPLTTAKSREKEDMTKGDLHSGITQADKDWIAQKISDHQELEQVQNHVEQNSTSSYLWYLVLCVFHFATTIFCF